MDAANCIPSSHTSPLTPIGATHCTHITIRLMRAAAWTRRLLPLTPLYPSTHSRSCTHSLTHSLTHSSTLHSTPLLPPLLRSSTRPCVRCACQLPRHRDPKARAIQVAAAFLSFPFPSPLPLTSHVTIPLSQFLCIAHPLPSLSVRRLGSSWAIHLSTPTGGENTRSSSPGWRVKERNQSQPHSRTVHRSAFMSTLVNAGRGELFVLRVETDYRFSSFCAP